MCLPEPPSLNKWTRIWRGRVLLSREARAYKETARQLALFARLTCVEKPALVGVRIVWYRSRKVGDLDNRLKIVLDALRGVMYDDDSQIDELHAWRQDDPDQKGTVMVTVWPKTSKGPHWTGNGFNVEMR